MENREVLEMNLEGFEVEAVHTVKTYIEKVQLYFGLVEGVETVSEFRSDFSGVDACLLHSETVTSVCTVIGGTIDGIDSALFKKVYYDIHGEVAHETEVY